METFDTNIVVRLIVEDDEDQSRQAEAAQCDPKEPAQRRHSYPGSPALADRQLLAKSEVLENEIGSGLEEGSQRSQASTDHVVIMPG